MMDIYANCGVWKPSVDKRWSFSADANGGRLLSLESSMTLNELRVMVLEDYEMEQSNASVRLSYIPADLVKNLEVPPVFITNDRQVMNFLGYAKKFPSTYLFVTFEATIGNQQRKVDIDHKKEASSEEFAEPVIMNDNFKSNNNGAKVDGYCEMKKGSQKNVRFWMVDCVKKGELFKSKNVLQATLEICAMKHNFDYWVVKSDKTKWYVRCKDDICNWTVWASCLHGSTYFIVNKCVA